MTPRDLLALAGSLVQLAATVRREAQLAAIAAVVRGHVAPEQAAQVPSEAFDGPAVLLAWVCATRARRLYGRRASFDLVRAGVDNAPLDLPADVARDLRAEAERVIDEAEWTAERPRAVAELLEQSGASSTGEMEQAA